MHKLLERYLMEQDTEEAKILDSGEDLRYDSASKMLLACKPILTRILQDCAVEYKDCEPEVIEKLITSTHVRCVAVEEDKTVISYRAAIGKEDVSLTEGKVVYDIYCTAKIPNSDRETDLFFNIESQKKFHTSYPLVSRAVYYTARMLSSQHGVLNEELDYGALRKVYSIWICTDPPKYKRNTKEEYRFVKVGDDSHQEGDEDEKQPYDLQHIVFLHLGTGDEDDGSGILKLLSVIMSEDKSVEEKKKFCNDHNIPMTKEIDLEVNAMSVVLDRVRKKVREDVIYNNNIELLNEFVKDRMPLATIARYLKMSVEKVREMIREKIPDCNWYFDNDATTRN